MDGFLVTVSSDTSEYCYAFMQDREVYINGRAVPICELSKNAPGQRLQLKLRKFLAAAVNRLGHKTLCRTIYDCWLQC